MENPLAFSCTITASSPQCNLNISMKLQPEQKSDPDSSVETPLWFPNLLSLSSVYPQDAELALQMGIKWPCWRERGWSDPGSPSGSVKPRGNILLWEIYYFEGERDLAPQCLSQPPSILVHPSLAREEKPLNHHPPSQDPGRDSSPWGSGSGCWWRAYSLQSNPVQTGHGVVSGEKSALSNQMYKTTCNKCLLKLAGWRGRRSFSIFLCPESFKHRISHSSCINQISNQAKKKKKEEKKREKKWQKPLFSPHTHTHPRHLCSFLVTGKVRG